MPTALFASRQRAARESQWRPSRALAARLCALGVLACLAVAVAAHSVPEQNVWSGVKNTRDMYVDDESSLKPSRPRHQMHIPLEHHVLVAQPAETQAEAEAWAWLMQPGTSGAAGMGLFEAFPADDAIPAVQRHPTSWTGSAALGPGQAASLDSLTQARPAPAFSRRLLQGSGPRGSPGAGEQPVGLLLLPGPAQVQGGLGSGDLMGGSRALRQAVVPTDATALAAVQAAAGSEEGGISITTSNPIAISNPTTSIAGSFSWGLGRKQL
ncbi:hypothetical protein V8C86DRAFT_1464548 [Haematococcus lacustris]